MYKASRKEKNIISEVYSRAFHNDPLFTYFFPNEETRKNKSRYTFRFSVSYAIKNGTVTASSENFEGVGVWLHSDKIDFPILSVIRHGGLMLLLKQGISSVLRQLKVDAYMKSINKRYINGSYMYLFLLAVDTEFQSKGFSSKVLLPMLKELDSKKIPCYLDTNTEKNMQLYKRFGFKVIKYSIIPGTDVHHWAMLRDPK